MAKIDLVDYDGLLMSPSTSYERFKEATTYQPREGDVFVSSYHKCGTTWLQYIVFEILNKRVEPPYVHEMFMDYGNQIEKLGVKRYLAKNDEYKRHFKTHLPFNYVPYNEKAKYIYIVRNPWDVCVSYFNMLTQMPKYTEFSGSFDEFFEEFIAGRTDCGSYFDHVVSWYKQSGKENILFLTFEETKRNTRETILKVAKFLGDSYFNDLNTSEEEMQKILEYTSFDYMKKLPFVVPKTTDVARKTGVFNVGKNIDLVNTGDYINIQFFKAGKTSYTKEHYTEQQKAIMKRMINQHFAQFPDLLSLWKQFNVDL